MTAFRPLATGLTFLAMLCVGVAWAVIGAAAQRIGLAPADIGFLLSAEHAGFAVAVAAAGALADSRPKSRIFAFGGLVLAATFPFVFGSTDVLLNLLLLVGVGVGIGAFEGVSDAFLLDLYSTRAGRFVSINHFFATLGSVAIAVWLLAEDVSWRASLVASAVAAAVVGVGFLAIRSPARPSVTSEVSDAPRRGRLRSLPDKPLLALLALAVLLSVGMEAGCLGMLTSCLVDLQGVEPGTARIALVLHLVGLGAGRLVLGWMADDRALVRHLLALFAASAVLMGLLFCADVGGGPAIALAFLAGVGLSAQVPFLLTIGGLRWPQARGAVLGVLKVAIPAGGALLPFLMSVATVRTSFATALWLLPATGLAGAVVVLATARRLRRSAASA